MLTIGYEGLLIITLTDLDLTLTLKRKIIFSIFIIIIEMSSQYYFKIVWFKTNTDGVM
jgi:hypothetical protein